MNKKLIVNITIIYYFIVFIFTITFIFFHLHNLPIGTYSPDEVTHIKSGIETSYTDFFRLLFLTPARTITQWCMYGPLSPDHRSDITAIYNRPGLCFISKLIYDTFGFNENIFYFSQALIIAGIAMFIFYFLYVSTKKRFFSFIATIFFITLPPVFSATWLLSDTEILAQFFLMCSIFIFYKLVYSKEEIKKRVVLSLLFVIFFLLAVRTKETTKIFLGVILFLTILFYRRSLWQLILPLGIILYYIFPTKNEGIIIITQFNFGGIYQKVIAAGVADYAAEVPTIFSIKQHFTNVPASMLSQFGFFLGWFIIISLVFITIKSLNYNNLKKLFEKIKNNQLPQEEFIFFVSFIWLLVTITAYGFFLHSVEHRYLTGGLIPLTLLVFICIDKTARYIRKKFQLLYKTIFILLVLFVILINAYHITFHIRGGTIGFYEGNFDITKFILSKDNDINYTNWEVSSLLFNRGYSEKYLTMVKVNSLNNIFMRWPNYPIIKGPEEFNESFLQNNVTLYYVNLYSNSPPINIKNKEYTISYLAAFGGCFSNSFYCKVKNVFIEPKRTHYLFQINKIKNTKK